MKWPFIPPADPVRVSVRPAGQLLRWVPDGGRVLWGQWDLSGGDSWEPVQSPEDDPELQGRQSETDQEALPLPHHRRRAGEAVVSSNVFFLIQNEAMRMEDVVRCPDFKVRWMRALKALQPEKTNHIDALCYNKHNALQKRAANTAVISQCRLIFSSSTPISK